jgi:hypothetical protein
MVLAVDYMVILDMVLLYMVGSASTSDEMGFNACKRCRGRLDMLSLSHRTYWYITRISSLVCERSWFKKFCLQ